MLSRPLYYFLRSIRCCSSSLPQIDGLSGVPDPFPLGDALTIILSLEAFLLIWLWLEMPRRRKSRNRAQKDAFSAAAISGLPGRIVSLKSEELEQGLRNELYAIGEMLQVDQISWFQQCRDGAHYARMQTSKVSEEIPPAVESPLSQLPWISDGASGRRAGTAAAAAGFAAGGRDGPQDVEGVWS